MENITIEKPKKTGKVSLIFSIALSILAVISLGFTINFIVEHYILQSTAEGFEGLGSVVLIIFALIFGCLACLLALISIIINVLNIIKRTGKIKLISIILLAINIFVIIANITALLILKFVPA